LRVHRGWRWWWSDEGKRKDSTFVSDEDEGEFDHATSSSEDVDVVRLVHSREIFEGEDGVDTRSPSLENLDYRTKVEFSRVDSWERHRGRETSEDGEVEELIRSESHVGEDVGFRSERDGEAFEIDVENDSVNSVKHEHFFGSVDRVYVSTFVTFEVSELSPGEIRCDDEFVRTLLEESVNESKNVFRNDRI